MRRTLVEHGPMRRHAGERMFIDKSTPAGRGHAVKKGYATARTSDGRAIALQVTAAGAALPGSRRSERAAEALRGRNGRSATRWSGAWGLTRGRLRSVQGCRCRRRCCARSPWKRDEYQFRAGILGDACHRSLTNKPLSRLPAGRRAPGLGKSSRFQGTSGSRGDFWTVDCHDKYVRR